MDKIVKKILLDFNVFVKKPQNYKIKTNYLSNISKEVLDRISFYKKNIKNIPIVINGKNIYSNEKQQISPYEKNNVICNYNQASDLIVKHSINQFKLAKNTFSKLSVHDKISIFEKLSNLVENKYKNDILATTILGQGKTIHQAEIDAIGELIDFLNFNTYFYSELVSEQLYLNNSDDSYNISKWNPLNGFVASITPFNFTAIGANLATAPLLMNNYVLWKPSDNSILSNYIFFEALLESGMPPECISFIPSNPETFFNEVSNSSDLGGICFTGSSEVFENIYETIGKNIKLYNNFPRIVGETGGMNFHFAFEDFDLDNLVNSTIRGAFEYSGQKCSATSRLYLPKSRANEFYNLFFKELDKLIFDSPEKENTFSSAVINENAYLKCKNAIENLKNTSELIYGGNYCDDIGYYIYPTVFKVNNHENRIMNNEIFGPILNVYEYDDVNSALELCSNNIYGLTGALFTKNEENFLKAEKYLENSCGNYYINDKCTGSVVFQQPFGGSKKSGTNDKAGSKYLLPRFGNNRIIKIKKLN